MDMERAELTVDDLLSLHSNQMLRANPEYQRGVVWSTVQKKKLIDSLLRGYPLPLIYLHHIKRLVAGAQRDDFEIIDGQQRINSLYEFREGAFKLLDPMEESNEGKFPNFIKAQACPWAGMDFESLPSDLKKKFLETSLAVAKIYTDDANEVRDLFVRLQAGLPLNAQEARDAWPGQFTDFVLWLGGKPQLARYPGHPFFRRVMRMKPETDRGKTELENATLVHRHCHPKGMASKHFADHGNA